MYKNATVEVFAPVLTKNSEGTTVKSWPYKATPTPGVPNDRFRADVQPARLSESDRTLYGIDVRSSDTKVLYFERGQTISINSRVRVTSDFPGEAVFIYEIRGVNHWPRHAEAIIVPVIGE